MRRRSKFLARGALATWELHYGPNMTPMVDVVMVILVFFMASTAVLGPEWFLRSAIPQRRPEASATDPARSARAELRLVFENGATRVTGAGLTNGTLADAVLVISGLASDRDPADVSVVIRPDATVPYRDLVALHEACQRAGVTKVGMMDP
jgi:biopolymer transport protein ExbD